MKLVDFFRGDNAWFRWFFIKRGQGKFCGIITFNGTGKSCKDKVIVLRVREAVQGKGGYVACVDRRVPLGSSSAVVRNASVCTGCVIKPVAVNRLCIRRPGKGDVSGLCCRRKKNKAEKCQQKKGKFCISCGCVFHFLSICARHLLTVAKSGVIVRDQLGGIHHVRISKDYWTFSFPPVCCLMSAA